MNVSQSTSTVASHIELRPNREGAMRAYVAGTRIRVQDIVSDHERHGLSPEEIVREYPQLSLAQVHAALAFYYDHRDELRADMKADEAYARSAQAAYGKPAIPSTGEGAGDEENAA